MIKTIERKFLFADELNEQEQEFFKENVEMFIRIFKVKIATLVNGFIITDEDLEVLCFKKNELEELLLNKDMKELIDKEYEIKVYVERENSFEIVQKVSE